MNRSQEDSNTAYWLYKRFILLTLLMCCSVGRGVDLFSYSMQISCYPAFTGWVRELLVTDSERFTQAVAVCRLPRALDKKDNTKDREINGPVRQDGGTPKKKIQRRREIFVVHNLFFLSVYAVLCFGRKFFQSYAFHR